MRGILTASLVVALTVLTGCDGQQPRTSHSSSSTQGVGTTTTPSTPPTAPVLPPSEATPVPAAAGCDVAPAEIVDKVNASFTKGEHVESEQSLMGPEGMVIVGANIVDSSGTLVSSSDSWVMSGDTVYGLSGDARRHTTLADGRGVLGDNWTNFNDAVGQCVQAATRAGNK